MKKNSFNEGIYFIKKPKKLLLTMKLTVLFSLICLFPSIASVYSQEEKISLDIDNKAIKEVLREIEMVSEYRFFFSDDLLPLDERVNLKVKNEKVKEVLNNLLSNKALSYQLVNNNLVLIIPDNLKQEIILRGKVTDTYGNSLPGVNIIEVGTTNGAVTDLDGNYTITVSSEDAVLSFSFVGYLTEEIQLSGQTSFDITLIEDILALDEVVVIGYGTQRKADLTGSVASISSEEIQKVPVLTLDQAMQGAASGVDVRQISNVPGGDVKVRIRGLNSINGNNDPLYVIDGVIGGNINTVDPNDIESIDILKDAAAASIYGARGANGVVMVTTKRGNPGKPQVNFDMRYGIDQPGELYDMMNAREYMEFVNDANTLNNNPLTYTNINQVVSQIGEGTAWQDEIFKNGSNQKYYLSVNGGNETVTYLASGSYQKQEGLIPSVDFERYTARLNIDIQASDHLKFGSNISYVHSNRHTFAEDASTSFPDFTGPVAWTVSNPPILDPYDENGNQLPILDNPFAVVSTRPYNNGLFQVNEKRESLSDFLQMNFYGEYKIIDQLIFKVTLGVQPTFSEGRFFNPFEVPNQFQEQFRSASKSVSRSGQWLIEPTLTYQNTFIDRHALTVMVGSSNQKTKFENTSASSQDFPFDFVEWNALEAGTQGTFSIVSGLTETQYQAFFGRINYAFNDRYLIQVNGRYDGTSKFADDNKWAFFPSVSAGWRLSEEDFMQDLDFFDVIKLRTSYGSIGSHATSAYATIAQLAVGGGFDRYAFGDQAAISYIINMANPNLVWEETTQFDVGLDLGLLEGRLNLTMDYYNKKTTDLILNQFVTIVNAAERDHDPDITRNVGSMRNTGFEFNGDLRSNLGQNITWDLNLNFTYQANEVLDLNLAEDQEFIELGNNLIRNYHRLQPGEPFGNYAGYKTDGLFQTQEEIDGSAQPSAQPGDLKYVDMNNDGMINENDKTIVGNAYPDFISGLTNTFTFKGIELSFMFYGAFGHQLFNMGAQRFKYDLNVVEYNKLKEVATERWTGPGTSNDIPRAGNSLINGTDGPNGTIDIVTEDASFVKLKNLTIAYNLPKSMIKNIGLQNLRVYFKGQNLLHFTDYSGYDPEASNFRSTEVLLPLETLYYPFVKSYMFGVNLEF